ncbi:S-adenosyl-L-methionine-dependent methyltransferase [Lipomyces orientalis]|uniref:S-adenosyl-L-methionine-dependent methyltransferase n=1 Tax=Lipomyces orientalis TaxID=1233043 RepID=A0ACC3TQU0_9ASCO
MTLEDAADDASLVTERVLRSPYPILPTPDEIERLEFQHSVISQILGGRFLPAIGHFDIHTRLKILDCGSGSGTWASEIGFALPESTVTGFDIFDVPAKFKPANVDFVVADANDTPMPFADSMYDIIHSRFLFLGITDWLRYILELKRLVKSNTGEIHLIETTAPPLLVGDDDTSLVRELVDTLGQANISIIVASKLGDYCRAAGLTVTHEKMYPFAYGDWPEDPEQSRIGGLMLSCTMEGVEKIARRVCETKGYDSKPYMAQLATYLDQKRKPAGEIWYVVAKKLD